MENTWINQDKEHKASTSCAIFSTHLNYYSRIRYHGYIGRASAQRAKVLRYSKAVEMVTVASSLGA